MINILTIGGNSALNSVKSDLVKQGIKLTTSAYANIWIEIIDNNVEVYVKNEKLYGYDVVWINSSWRTRQFSDAICVYLASKKIPYTEVEGEKSKIVDFVQLAVDNVSLPNTLYCQTDKLIKNITNIERVCKYPVIVKVTRGSLGNGVYLAKDKAELLDIINNKCKSGRHYVCQEYIPNNHDYRIIVSGQNSILSANKRVRQNDEFRNNAYLGATEVFMDKSEVCKELSKISIDAVKSLQLDWAGVDIVQSTANNKYYIIEVNRRPGLTLKSSEVVAAYDHITKLLFERGLIS